MSLLTVKNGDVKLAVETWGDSAQPVVILIHGYPDNRNIWRGVAERLAKRFFVVAYDVRGAGQSTRPQRLGDYRLEHLAADFKAVIDAAAPGRPVHVVGHDWGSIQAWEAVWSLQDQGRIASFTSISGPCLDHIGHLFRSLLSAPSAGNMRKLGGQLISSWYIMAFQLPLLAPLAWRLGVGKNWPRLLGRIEGLPNIKASSTQTVDGVAGIALYRANMLPRLLWPQDRQINVPVQILTPLEDPFVRPQLFEALPRWVGNVRRQEIKAGHWLPLSQPAELAGAIENFSASIS